MVNQWDRPLEFGVESLKEAKTIEEKIINFINNIKFYEKKVKNTYTKVDETYYNNIFMAFKRIDKNLKNNFNTRDTIKEILKIMKITHIYLSEDYNYEFITYAYDNVIKIISMLGIQLSKNNQYSKKTELIELGLNLRENIRKLLLKNKKNINKNFFNDMINILDDFRDNKLKDVGIKLDNKGDSKSWSFI